MTLIRVLSLLLLTVSSTFAGGAPFSAPYDIRDPQPLLECVHDACNARIVADVDGKGAISDIIVYSAGQKTQRGRGWTLGEGEDIISLDLEVTSQGMLLVRKETGFEHINVSYTLLAPVQSRLDTIKTWSTGAGPDWLLVTERDGEFLVERTSQTGDRSQETWQYWRKVNGYIRSESRRP